VVVSLLGLLSAVALVLFGQWLNATKIWVTSHARPSGRYRKFVASQTAKNPADPFIDSEGCRAYIDTAEAEYRRGVVH
jgi:hypothetical protein